MKTKTKPHAGAPPRSEANSRENSSRRISLRAAYSVVLAVWEKELGVREPRGEADPNAAERGAGFVPTRRELIDAVNLAPRTKVVPGDETISTSRRNVSLGELAMVNAHFEILRYLQETRMTAFSACLISSPTPGAIATVPRLPIRADIWKEDWGFPAQPGESQGEPAGVVPDYAESLLVPFIDFKVREQVWHLCIEVDKRELRECLRRNHPRLFASVGENRAELSGKFQLLGKKLMVAFGDVTAKIDATEGMAAIRILLANPDTDVRWDALSVAANIVARERVNPRVAIDAAVRDSQLFTRPEQTPKIRDPHAIKEMETEAKRLNALALSAPPEEQARLRQRADEAEQGAQRLRNERRTAKTAFVKKRENIYNKMEFALLRIASACPPFIRHLGLLRETDRRALVVGDRVVRYAPNSRISWEMEPPDGWAQKRRPSDKK